MNRPYPKISCLNKLVLNSLLSCLCLYSNAQFKNLSIKNRDPEFPRQFNSTNKLQSQSVYSRLRNPVISNKNVRSIITDAQQCNTTTFYITVPAPAGQKIELKQLQTLPGGDFLSVGNITLANGDNEGLIIRMTNAGVIITQKQFRVNNKPVTFYDLRVTVDGSIIIAGVINDGTNSVFVASLQDDLTINRINFSPMASAVKKVTLDLFSDNNKNIALAIQLSSSVIYAALNDQVSILWSKEIFPDGLVELVGFTTKTYNTLGLITNCLRAGRNVTDISDISNADGAIAFTYTAVDNMEECNYKYSTAFAGRLNMLGIVNNPVTGFQLTRDIIYDASAMETEHRYTIPATIDFTISAKMDNAGDALGICFPAESKLIFIKHFNYYETYPEHTRQYVVPAGSTLISIARSFDGGYLFGLSNTNSASLTFIKVDSTGILAGCGYQDITSATNQTLNKKNTPAIGSSVNKGVLQTAANLTNTDAALSSQFTCQQNYCPEPPVEDTCLATYFKTYRSNSFADIFTDYFLMRNNNQLVASQRYDRILGETNELTYGLKLFDERGKFIKGVEVFHNGLASGSTAKKINDQNIILINTSIKEDKLCFTLTKVSDDLQIQWTKTIRRTIAGDFILSGPGSIDLHADEEGNLYLIAVSEGFSQNPKLFVHKMDPSGNELWTKTFQLTSRIFFTASATSTKTSLIIVIDGTNPGDLSIQMDKNSGQIIKSYNFTNQYSGSEALYHRLLKFDNDRIYYAGSTESGRFLMALFDTTGKPLKQRMIDQDGSIMRAADERFSSLYASYNYWDGTKYSDVLFKTDSNLNIIFMNEYSREIDRYPTGLAVSDLENIYVGGTYFHGDFGQYVDPYLIKYNSVGETGTCSYTKNEHPPVVDLTPQVTNIVFADLPRSIEGIIVPVNFVSDLFGQHLERILCSSVPSCNFIKLSGPDKLCKLNQDYSYKTEKNATCTLNPLWSYDTSYVVLQQTTDSGAVFQFKKTGMTKLKVRLNAGCKFYDDSLLVEVQKSPAFFTLGRDTSFCPGDSIKLNAGQGFNTYKWQDGSTDSIFIVKKPGQFFVHTENVCGDVYNDTISAAIISIPLFTIGNDTTVCLNDTLHLQATAGFKNYTWLAQSTLVTAGQNASIVLLQDALISIRANTNEGCIASDTVLATVRSPRPVFLGPDTSFCSADSLRLNAGAGYAGYLWSNGNQSSSVTVYTQGNYWVRAKDLNGCTAKDTITVKVFAKPEINLGNDFNLCSGETKKLDAGQYKKYLWQDGSVDRFHLVSDTGVLWVKILDTNNCTNTDTITIKTILSLPSNFLNAIDSICQYDKLQLRPSGSYSNYQWSDGSTQSFSLIDKPGIYTLTVKDVNGCAGADTVRVFQKQCSYGIFIPSAFTPNGDLVNDVFRAKVSGNVISFDLKVYNRNGELVFRTTDPSGSWNGIFKGSLQPSAVFVWQCSYHLQGSDPVFKKGTVTLIR